MVGLDKISIAEMMAIAVLKGDMKSARPLADLVSEQYNFEGTAIKSKGIITVKSNNIRAIAYFIPDSELDDPDYTRETIRRWINGEVQVLLLQGCEKVELYDFQDSNTNS